MTTISIDMESTLVMRGFLLLLTGIVFAFGMAQNNTRSRLESQHKSTAFLSQVFVPIAQEREAARNPQGDNGLAQSYELDICIREWVQASASVPGVSHTHPPCSCRIWTHYALCMRDRNGVPRADQRAAEMRRAVAVSLSALQDEPI